MIRRTSYFSGHVQGVGFRYTAADVAGGFAVKGYVRNLPDGRVECVCEGSPDEVRRFLDALGQRRGHFIKQRTDVDSPTTGEFDGFEVRR